MKPKGVKDSPEVTVDFSPEALMLQRLESEAPEPCDIDLGSVLVLSGVLSQHVMLQRLSLADSVGLARCFRCDHGFILCVSQTSENYFEGVSPDYRASIVKCSSCNGSGFVSRKSLGFRPKLM